MSCKYKNSHYKSAVQFYNNANQTILATNTASNPVVVALGSQVTDTGVSIDFNSSGVVIENTGLYRLSADVVLGGGTAGIVNVAMTVNGTVLPETVKSITIGAGGTDTVIPLETIRQFNTCCTVSDYVVEIIAYSDGTAIGFIDSVSGNVVKLA